MKKHDEVLATRDKVAELMREALKNNIGDVDQEVSEKTLMKALDSVEFRERLGKVMGDEFIERVKRNTSPMYSRRTCLAGEDIKPGEMVAEIDGKVYAAKEVVDT